MTRDVHLKIVHKTGSSKNKKQHAVECEYICIEVNGREWTVLHRAGASIELHNQLIAAR